MDMSWADWVRVSNATEWIVASHVEERATDTRNHIVSIPVTFIHSLDGRCSLLLIQTIPSSFNTYQGKVSINFLTNSSFKKKIQIDFLIDFNSFCVFRYFGQPLVILMSPQDVPTSFQDYQHHGSLFTLFLHSPLTAVCYICNVGDVPIHHWERCQGYIEKFVTEASCLVTRCRVEDVGKGRDYIGTAKMSFPSEIVINKFINFKFLKNSSNDSLFFFFSNRFSLCAIFRRWFFTYDIIALHILRRCITDPHVISRETPAA